MHRAAVDARGPHAHEEAPVEARVVGAERAVALVGIEKHGAIIRPGPGGRSPFSDIEFYAAARAPRFQESHSAAEPARRMNGSAT